jgi:hypothetical protein
VSNSGILCELPLSRRQLHGLRLAGPSRNSQNLGQRAQRRDAPQTARPAKILTMLASTMLPEAYKHGGKLTGVIATVGFATAFGLHLFE